MASPEYDVIIASNARVFYVPFEVMPRGPGRVAAESGTPHVQLGRAVLAPN
jgi:hypothetical protein